MFIVRLCVVEFVCRKEALFLIYDFLVNRQLQGHKAKPCLEKESKRQGLLLTNVLEVIICHVINLCKRFILIL